VSSVTELELGAVPVHLVGTAHVSAHSVDEVREVIRRVKPEVVCVELCQGRYDALTKDNAFRDLDVFKVIREGKMLYLLAHLGLASYQRKLGQSLGVKPGSELVAAIEEAKAVGARVELIDRNIHTTLKRTWSSLGLWKRSMLLGSLLAGDDGDDDDDAKPVDAAAIEAMKEPKALSEMLSELATNLPEVKRPLIDERDQYLMAGVERAAAGAASVVAVVGAAHVPGMLAQRGQPVDVAALDALPKPSLLWTLVKWAIPAFLVFALVWGRVLLRRRRRRDRAEGDHLADLDRRRGVHAGRRRSTAVDPDRDRGRADRRDPSLARHRDGGRRGRGLAAQAHGQGLRAPPRRRHDLARLLAQPGVADPDRRPGLGPWHRDRDVGRGGVDRDAVLIPEGFS
jgi:pheromone shutdown protein TraB